MTTRVSVNDARGIMNGRFVSDDQDGPVPFSRGELIDAYGRGFSLFCIPEGSFISFPKGLELAHHPVDVGCERQPGWVGEVQRTTYVLAYPRLYLGTVNLSLEKQQEAVRPFSILMPYEIACMAASLRKRGSGPLFSGQARTEADCGCSTSHLRPSQLTAIATDDGSGRIRFSRGYITQVSPVLGVVVGVRRLVA